MFVFITFMWFKRIRQHKNQPLNEEKTKQNTEDIVQCAFCGVYIPQKNSVSHKKHIYCSIEHSQHHEQS